MEEMFSCLILWLGLGSTEHTTRAAWAGFSHNERVTSVRAHARGIETVAVGREFAGSQTKKRETRTILSFFI